MESFFDVYCTCSMSGMTYKDEHMQLYLIFTCVVTCIFTGVG